MGRDYSKTGCVCCRRRKKKCDEKKPGCDACIRNGFECVYDRGIVGVADGFNKSGPRDRQLPLRRSLSTVSFSDSTEAQLAIEAPAMTLVYYSPAAAATERDLGVLFQMMTQKPFLLKTVVASYSFIRAGVQGKIDTVDRMRYGQAIRSFREELSRGLGDRAQQLSILAALTYLGLMESVGPEIHTESFHHYRALASLLNQADAIEPRNWPDVPRNLYLLILEGLAYHLSCLPIFARNSVKWYPLWQFSRVYRKLTDVNPETGAHLQMSPMFSGQYLLFDIISRVTYYLRSADEAPVDEHILDRFEEQICCKRHSLDDEFGLGLYQTLDNDLHAAIYHNYKLCTTTLQLCVTALRKPLRSRKSLIDDLARQGLKEFKTLPHVAMRCVPLTWPLQFLAFSIREDDDFLEFRRIFEKLTDSMDNGHRSRATFLVDKLVALRRQHDIEEVRKYTRDGHLPIGFVLLRRETGLFG